MIHRLHPLTRDPGRRYESYGYVTLVDFPWKGVMQAYAADRVFRRHLRTSVPFGTTLTLDKIPDLWRSVETAGRMICHRYLLRHKGRFLPYMARYRCPAFVSPEGPVHGEDIIYMKNVSWILKTLEDREVRIRHPVDVYADSCLDFGYPFDESLHGMRRAFLHAFSRQCHPLFDGDEIAWRISHDTDLFESRMFRGDGGELETFRTLSRFGQDPVSQTFDSALASVPMSWFQTRMHLSPLSSFSLDPLPDQNEDVAGPEYHVPVAMMFDLPLTDCVVTYTLRKDDITLDQVTTCLDRLAGIAPHLEDVGRTLKRVARNLFQIARTQIDPEIDRITIEKTYLDEGRFLFHRKGSVVRKIYVDYALLGLTAPGAYVED